MRNHVLRIIDKNGKSFQISVSTPNAKSRLALDTTGKVEIFGLNKLTKYLADDLFGVWKVKDNGFISYKSGKTKSRLSHNGDMTTRDLLILGDKGITGFDGQEGIGMELFEYEDVFSVNDEGEGFVIQPWVVNLTPGRIRWKVID